MDEEARRPYIGLYARSPAEFRFPIGVKRALLLAVRELALAGRVSSDAATQTPSPAPMDFHSPCWPHGPTPPAVASNCNTTSLPQLPLFATDPGISSTPPPGSLGTTGVPVTSSRVHFHPIYGVTSSDPSSSNAAASPVSVASSTTVHHGHVHSALLTANGSVSGGLAMCTNGASPAHDHDVVLDLEKLKNNSTASIIRLSAKQYHDADLVEGRDFEVKIELSTGEDGFKRATGIYCCHLCLGKRGEVSAVRFSIAKNRYPVVSNVMSHLKIHFVARLPPLPRNMIGHAAVAAAAAAASGVVPAGAIVSCPPHTTVVTGASGQPVWPHMVKQEVAAVWATSSPTMKQEAWSGAGVALNIGGNPVWPSPQAVSSGVGPEVGGDMTASPTESTTEATSLDSNERC